MFRILKQMKPFRQLDVAQAMVNLGKYSIKLANTMLQNTHIDQLTDAAAMQADTRLLEENYGLASLDLKISKSYIGGSLLESATVVRWLSANRPDHLQQLQRITNIREISTASSTLPN